MILYSNEAAPHRKEGSRTLTTYGGSADLLGGLASGLGARIQTWVGGLFYLKGP